MDAVRYRPGDALRWLETGAGAHRKSARDKGRAILKHTNGVTAVALKEGVFNAASAIAELSKGAYAELVRRQAESYEIILGENEFTMCRSAGPRSFRYEDVTAISQDRDKVTITAGQTTLTIKPYAYITTGRVKVPIGWDRNGMEVPYELIVEELAARCRVEIDQT